MSDLFSKWRVGLSKTSKSAFGRLANLLGATEIDQETWDEMEAILIQADLGIETTSDVLDSLKRIVRDQGLTRANELRELLRVDLRSRLVTPPALNWNTRPSVILIVGVNGSGKTTTIAKLGKRFCDEGRSVLFGAADTFRAAAVDQLQIWGDRLKVEVVAGAPESDPGAVAFNAIQSGIAHKIDLILIDTAGRLHTRFNLMEELKKINRVIERELGRPADETLLVLDALVGT